MASEGKEEGKQWVKFEEDADPPSSTEHRGAVIDAETTQIKLEKVENKIETKAAPAVIQSESVQISIPSSKSPEPRPNSNFKTPINKAPLKTVDLSSSANGRSINTPQVGNAVIRQGFANGEIIVTLLPVNSQWPWVTPAKFRPELVPEELMAQGLTLTVEDYVHVMELLTNDVRFNMYNICYKRIFVVWLLSAFVVLFGLLFSGVTGLTLFGLGVMWLIANGAAVVLCMWLKIKLNHNLEKCLGQVNKHLIKHKILIGLDDRGKISCHKVNLCFIYFDSTDCIKKLHDVIEREDRENGRELTADERRERSQFQIRMDIDDSDIIIQGSNASRISRKQARAELLYLRYSSRWVKLFVRGLLELNVDCRHRDLPVSPPRHCAGSRCVCHYIEDHLKYKPRGHWCHVCAQGIDDGRGPSYPYLP